MPRSANDLREEFSAHLRYTDATRRRVERLYRAGHLFRKDVEIVYSGLFLDAFTSFERFIEELFLGLLSGAVAHRLKAVEPRVKFTTDAALWDIVIGPRYADWLPYAEKTEKRAEAFFKHGTPFNRLSNPEKVRLSSLIAIRHVLAHKSHHSMRQFEDKVLSGLMLTPRERTPAGFLRSIYATPPPRTRYEEAIADLQSIAERLC